MLSFTRPLFLAVALCLALTLPVQANNVKFAIYDMIETDTNFITAVNGNDIVELYQETFLDPYPFAQGYGIVDEAGRTFDKRIIFNEAFNTLTLTFKVVNSTPFIWTDYHFELVDYPSHISFSGGNAEQFQYEDITATRIDFWSVDPDFFIIPGSPGAPGKDQANMSVQLNNVIGGDIITIRQVATTVPLPPNALLLGTGLFTLAAWRRFKG